MVLRLDQTPVPKLNLVAAMTQGSHRPDLFYTRLPLARDNPKHRLSGESGGSPGEIRVLLPECGRLVLRKKLKHFLKVGVTILYISIILSLGRSASSANLFHLDRSSSTQDRRLFPTPGTWVNYSRIYVSCP